jgi:tetratricopeptide (TPR) repeat protein
MPADTNGQRPPEEEEGGQSDAAVPGAEPAPEAVTAESADATPEPGGEEPPDAVAEAAEAADEPAADSSNGASDEEVSLDAESAEESAEAEEIDDIEEIDADDVEMMSEDSAASAPRPMEPPPRLPTRPPPSPPPRMKMPTFPAPIEPDENDDEEVARAEDSAVRMPSFPAPIEPDEDEVEEAPPAGAEAVGAPTSQFEQLARPVTAEEAGAVAEEDEEPEPPPELDPLTEPLDVPTVLDKLVEEQKQGSREAQADAIQRELQASLSKERIGALAYELGELCERQLGDEARAVKAFGRALQADPSLRSNLWAIRRVFYRRGLWPNLVKLIGAETRFAPDDAARADLLVERGHILEDQVGDSGEAAQSYQQAALADATCLPALHGLERLALRQGDNATLETVWPKLAAGCETVARKQAYLLDLVKLLGERGGDDLDRAREVMQQAVELGGSSDRLSAVREWLAEKSGDPEELLAALDARAADLMSRFGPAGPPAQFTRPKTGAEGAEQDALSPVGEAALRLRRQVVAVRRRQAHIAIHQIGATDRAWSYLQQATELAPGEPLLVADLADLAEQLGKYDELAELVESWEAHEVDPARSLSLSLRRADALFRAGHDDAARALVATLSATQPGYLPILALRERDALVSGDHTALAETYAAAAEAARTGRGFGPGATAEPDEGLAAGYYMVAGDLYRHKVRTPEVARARYAQALEVLPGYPPAVEALGSLHEQAGRYDDAAALYELHSESGEQAFRVHVLERLVDIYRRMGRLDEVEGALRRLIQLDPESPAHRWRHEEILDELGRPDDRAQALVDLAERLDDPDQRAGVLLEAARLQGDVLGHLDKAIPLYREVIDTWPADAYARQALASSLRREGNWEQLVVELRAAAREADTASAVRSLREAANVLLDVLDRPADAVQVYRDLVDRAPGEADALRGLAESLARAGDTEGALEIIEREVDARGEGPGAEEANLRLAAVAESLGKTDEAEAAYRRALIAQPDSARAAVGQLDLAIRRTDAVAEAEVLARIAESPIAEVVAAELCERAGWLTALAVSGDTDEAVRLFDRALELEPARRGALLGKLLVEARVGDPFALGDALGALAAALPTSYVAASLWVRAAVLSEVQSDERGLEQRIRSAVAAAPTDPGAIVAASEYLSPIGPLAHKIPGGPAELARRAELYAGRAQVAGDPASQHDWQLGQAELYEALGRLNDSLAIATRVLEQRPDDVRALQLLRRICRRGGDREGLARASAALGRIIGDREGKIELLRESAAIFDGELNRVDHAVPLYRTILAEDPGAREFERLHEILSAHDDVAGQFECLSVRIHHLEEPDRRRTPVLADLLVERAGLRGRLGDDRGMARDLGAALEVDSRNADALFLRGHVLRRLDRPEEAARHLERFLEHAGDDERRPQAELALSEILAENMDDLAGAIVNLEHVARQAPHDIGLRERLVDLMVRAGEHRRAADELKQLERMRETSSEKARDLLRLAGILRDHVGDKNAAVATLERVRQLEPLSSEPVRQLVELYPEASERRAGILTQAASDLREAIALEPLRVQLYERLAAVMQWAGDDQARAFALAALGAVGSLSADQRRFLAEFAARRRSEPDLTALGDPLHPTDWEMLRDPSARGFAADVWSVIWPAVLASLPTEANQLGFGKANRLRGKDLDKGFPNVMPVLRAFGCGEPDVYVSDGRSGTARVIIGEKPALFLGADVASGKGAAARFHLGRAAALLRSGTGPLADLGEDELAAWFAAAAQIADSKAPEAVLARADSRRIGEKVKFLGREIARRERKMLAAAGARFAELGDPGEWRRAVLGSAARAGLLICGDLAVVLDQLDVGRGARSLSDDRAALAVVAWAASAEHLHLRRRLGLAR